MIILWSWNDPWKTCKSYHDHETNHGNPVKKHKNYGRHYDKNMTMLKEYRGIFNFITQVLGICCSISTLFLYLHSDEKFHWEKLTDTDFLKVKFNAKKLN